jgi:hypothetical protein
VGDNNHEESDNHEVDERLDMAAIGTTVWTGRSPLNVSVHWGEAVMATSRLKRRELTHARLSFHTAKTQLGHRTECETYDRS